MTNKLIIERYQDYVFKRMTIPDGQPKDRTFGGIPLYKVPSAWHQDSYNYAQHLVLMYKVTLVAERDYHFKVKVRHYPYAIYGEPFFVDVFQADSPRMFAALSHEDGMDITVVYAGKLQALSLQFLSNRIKWAIGKKWGTLPWGQLPNFPLEVIDADNKKPGAQVKIRQRHDKEDEVQIDRYSLIITDAPYLSEPIKLMIIVTNGQVSVQHVTGPIYGEPPWDTTTY